MSGVTYEDLLSGEITATAVDLKSGTKFVLTTRLGSRCLFFKIKGARLAFFCNPRISTLS